MKFKIRAVLLFSLYFTLAIFEGRGAYWNRSWPLWACILVVLPIIVIGSAVAYVFWCED